MFNMINRNKKSGHSEEKNVIREKNTEGLEVTAMLHVTSYITVTWVMVSTTILEITLYAYKKYIYKCIY